MALFHWYLLSLTRRGLPLLNLGFGHFPLQSSTKIISSTLEILGGHRRATGKKPMRRQRPEENLHNIYRQEVIGEEETHGEHS